MLSEETLGSNEEFYIENLDKIIPRLSRLPRKKYIQYEKILLGIKPQIDEDVVAVFNNLMDGSRAKLIETVKVERIIERKHFENTKVLTDRGLLQKDVNDALSKYSIQKLIPYGNVKSKEPIIIFLIVTSMGKYSSDGGLIYDLAKNIEWEEVEKGFKIFMSNMLRKIRKEKGIKIPLSLIFDNHWFINGLIFSFKGFNNEITKEFELEVNDAAYKLIYHYIYKKIMENNELVLKWLSIPKKFTAVLLEICVIRWVEKNIVNKKILKDDNELMKILGIPYNTYRRKSAILESLIIPILDEYKGLYPEQKIRKKLSVDFGISFKFENAIKVPSEMHKILCEEVNKLDEQQIPELITIIQKIQTK